MFKFLFALKFLWILKIFLIRTMGIMMFSLKLLWLDLKCNFNKKDILDDMQHHLKQMEQELEIVGEESKELQQRLSIRQEELEKKVRKDV